MTILMKECAECIKLYTKYKLERCAKCANKCYNIIKNKYNNKKLQVETYSLTKKIIYKNYPEDTTNLDIDCTYFYPYKLYSLVKKIKSKL
jgi:hypothetical protein